jgi:hypothetical protein
LRLAVVAACVCSALQADDPPRGQARSILRELRSDSMKPPAATQASAKLQEAIRILRLLRLPQPGKALPQLPPATPPTQPATRPARQELLSPDVLAEIAKRAGDVPHPTALADALFQAGKARTAYVVYEAALASEEVPDNKAWIIFQMGNCRRVYDPAGCRPIYQRLLAEHPNSPWVPLAQARDHLTEWYAVNKPAELLAQEEAAVAAPK